MRARTVIGLGVRTIVVAVVLGISFGIGGMVSGLGRQVPAPAGAAAATGAASPANTLRLLFIASLVQAMVATCIVREAKGSG